MYATAFKNVEVADELMVLCRSSVLLTDYRCVDTPQLDVDVAIVVGDREQVQSKLQLLGQPPSIPLCLLDANSDRADVWQVAKGWVAGS